MAQALTPPSSPRKIAILPWGHVIEDFLDPIGLDLDAFCTRMSEGWMFGYIEALRRVGWDPCIVCVSRNVAATRRLVHAATGATVWALPSPRLFRRLRRGMRTTYGWLVEDAFGPVTGLAWTRGRALRAIVPYLATPPLALARVLRRERCAAILVQEYEWPRFDVAVGLGRMLGVPVYATFQGGDRHPPGRIEDALRVRALRAARGLAIATADETERVRRDYAVAAARIARVPNPIDLDRWRPIDRGEARASLDLPAGARVAIYHGRIEMFRKGLDVLLDAWAALVAARTGRDLRLLIVGSGADDDALRARLADPALASVRWLGGYELDRAAMRRYLSAADVHAIASRREGLPVAPLEAMACGLPVAASDIPPLRDILERGLDSGGLTAPVGDADAFAAALGRFLDDPALALATGRSARATVEARFSVDAVAEQLGAMLGRG